MRILLRHTLRSIKDNIGQLIVILLTVTVVSALFFATVTIGGLFTNLQTSIRSRLNGDTDVTVENGTFSSARFNEFIEANSDKVEYAESYTQIPSLFRPSDGAESKAVLTEATDLKAFAARHKDMPIFEEYGFSYGYPEVWIGRSFAEENGIKAGDTIGLYLETDQKYRYLTVSYIFENYGIFANNVINNVLIDYSAVGNKGLINIAGIKLKEGADKDAFKNELQAYLGNSVGVTDSVDIGEITRIVSSNRRLLNIVLTFVTALMAFILLTSFLVVTKKRIAEFGLFRAAGASETQITVMCLAEGLIYGFVGACLGTALGRIGMQIAANAVIPNFPDAVSYGVGDYLSTILFGTAVSGLSALLPVIKARRDSVRRATSGSASVVRKRSPIPVVCAAVFVVVFALCTAFVKENTIIFNVLLVFGFAVFVFLAAPSVMSVISLFLRRVNFMRAGSMGIRRNPLAGILSAMTGFVIVFTFVTVGIVNIIIGAITPENSRFKTDFVIESASNADLKEINKEIEKIYGVTSANFYYYDTFICDSDTQNSEYTIYGADSAEAVRQLMPNIDIETARRFDTELNPIVISYDLVKRFGWGIGQTIKPVLFKNGEKGKELYDEFIVVGIDYTETANDRKAVIRNSSFRVDGKEYKPSKSVIFVNTSKDVPNDDLYRDMRDKCEEKYCYILSFGDWAYATSVGIRGVAALLRILQALISLVALVGVVNLTIVSLMERKREFNVFRALGMDRRLFILLALTESLIIALSGALMGIGLSLIVNLLMPSFAVVIDRYIGFAAFPWEIAVIAAVIIAAYSFIYVIGAATGRKKSTIERNKAY